MKKLLTWTAMLTKRLYRKATFLAIVVLIPVLVLGYSAAAKEDSGVLTVALARSDSDPMAVALTDRLLDSGQLLRVQLCESPQEAETLVRAGKADTAWILQSDLSQRLTRFVSNPSEKNAFITVLVREDTVLLKLAREKLSGAVYALCARQVYLDYVRENVPELSALSDEALLDYFEDTFEGQQLFVFDETDTLITGQEPHYLTSPVRGLLAVVILLAGLAAALYHMGDRRRGTFAWLSAPRRDLAELGCQLVTVGNVALVALITLLLSGLSAPLSRELPALALYCLSVSCFCALLRRLCRTERVLAAAVPVLVVASLVLCPVFFELDALRGLRWLLPPTGYLLGVYDSGCLWGLAGYTAVSLAGYQIMGLLNRE